MPSRLSKMMTRLVGFIATMLSRRGRRQASAAAAASITPRPADSPRPPRRFGRRKPAKVAPIQAISLVVGDETAAGDDVSPLPEETVSPAVVADPQREQRHRTVPFRVADIAGFALTAESAFEHKYNNVMLTVQGKVIKRLPTDTLGAKHQKFIIALSSSQSLLVNHNIDDAPRVPFRLGDELEVRGRYVWNELGGELHWTHHDPNGKVAGGYIELLRTRKRYE